MVTKLWDAWQPGWLVADKESGRYADLDRIRPIDHHGEFFDVAGPLPVPAGPQGRPVIVQAGGSEGGLQLAGDFADVVFTVAQTQAKAVAFRDDIQRRAVAAGRLADDVKLSLGVVVIVGVDEADAQGRAQAPFGVCSQALTGVPPKPAKLTSVVSIRASLFSYGSRVRARSWDRASASVSVQNAMRSAGAGMSGE